MPTAAPNPATAPPGPASPISGRPGGRKVRVLCVELGLGGGGAEQGDVTLLRTLDRSRFDVSLYLLQRGGVHDHRLPPELPVRYGTNMGGRFRTNLPRMALEVLRLRRNCDVVLALSDGIPIYLSVLDGCGGRKPVVGWIRTDWPGALEGDVGRWNRIATKLLYPRVSAFTCVSRGAADSLMEFLPSARGRTAVVPSPIPLEDIRALAAEPVPAGAEEIFRKPVVMTACRLDRPKTVDVLMRAFARLTGRGLDANLLILGEGPDRPALEALGRQPGLAGRVFMPGFDTNPWRYMRRSAVFVLSSRREGLSCVMVEALALGIPVVASDCRSGPRELLDGTGAGRLVPVDDEDALADALRELLDTPGLARSMGEAGPRVCSPFDAVGVTRRMEEILLAHAGVAPGP